MVKSEHTLQICNNQMLDLPKNEITNHVRLSLKKATNHLDPSHNNYNFNNNFPTSKLHSCKSSGILNQYTQMGNPNCRTERMPNKSTNPYEQDNYKSLPDIHCKNGKSFKDSGGERQDWFEYKSRLAKSKPNLHFIGSNAYNNNQSKELNLKEFNLKELNLNNFINIKDSQTSSVVNLADAM